MASRRARPRRDAGCRRPPQGAARCVRAAFGHARAHAHLVDLVLELGEGRVARLRAHGREPSDAAPRSENDVLGSLEIPAPPRTVADDQLPHWAWRAQIHVAASSRAGTAAAHQAVGVAASSGRFWPLAARRRECMQGLKCWGESSGRAPHELLVQSEGGHVDASGADHVDDERHLRRGWSCAHRIQSIHDEGGGTRRRSGVSALQRSGVACALESCGSVRASASASRQELAR